MLPHDDAPGVAAVEHEGPEEDGRRVGEVDGKIMAEDKGAEDPADPKNPRAVSDADALDGGEVKDVGGQVGDMQSNVEQVEEVWKEIRGGVEEEGMKVEADDEEGQDIGGEGVGDTAVGGTEDTDLDCVLRRFFFLFFFFLIELRKTVNTYIVQVLLIIGTSRDSLAGFFSDGFSFSKSSHFSSLSYPSSEGVVEGRRARCSFDFLSMGVEST